MLSGGTRIEGLDLHRLHRVIVVKNPDFQTNARVITVEPENDGAIRKYRCVEKVKDISPILISCYAILFFTAPVVHKNLPISERRYKKTRIIARIYAAVLCAAVIALTLVRTEITAPAFMGVFTTAILSLLGWFSKNTIGSFCKLSDKYPNELQSVGGGVRGTFP